MISYNYIIYLNAYPQSLTKLSSGWVKFGDLRDFALHYPELSKKSKNKTFLAGLAQAQNPSKWPVKGQFDRDPQLQAEYHHQEEEEEEEEEDEGERQVKKRRKSASAAEGQGKKKRKRNTEVCLQPLIGTMNYCVLICVFRIQQLLRLK